MSKYELHSNLIIEMCERLEKTELNKIKEPNVWDSTLMRFQVIGETLKKIPDKLKKKFPNVKWKNFEWFRNQISHEYRTIYPEVISELIKSDLKNLKQAIIKIRGENDFKK